MIIKEIQKRPFVRPLFIWITGTILQLYFSFQKISFGLLILPLIILLLSSIASGRNKSGLTYDMRWLWGAVFLIFLLFISIQITAYHQNKTISTSINCLQIAAKKAQENLIKPFDKLSVRDTEKSILSTITFGYRESIPKEVKRQFSATGVAHILAVSGFHVGIVCGFISLLLSFFNRWSAGRWIKYILTLIMLWIFVIVTGLAASSVRAAIMLTLYLTGRQLRRITDGYNTLAAAAFCMLVYNPFYLFDIGFLLSFTAVYFILYLRPKISSLIAVRNPILSTPWDWITVTLAAQTGVTFLCLYYFSQFSLVFLFTNLPLTLIATLLIPMALLWVILPVWIPGMEWLQYGIEYLIRGMVWIVDIFSRIPGGTLTIRFSFLTMILSYCILFLFLIYLQNRRPMFLLSSLFLLLIIMLVLVIDKYLLFEI